MTDERVRSLEGDRFDFDELITELNYDVFGNYVLSNERETVDPDMLKRANKVLGDCYKEALKKRMSMSQSQSIWNLCVAYCRSG